jgi:parvulin-like peptidyl-prolyl isomerase
VPEFDQAAFSLPVNQLSQVVKTQYGHHVLMVTEIRAQPPTPAQLQEQRQRGFDSYLQTVRQRATIERCGSNGTAGCTPVAAAARP